MEGGCAGSLFGRRPAPDRDGLVWLGREFLFVLCVGIAGRSGL